LATDLAAVEALVARPHVLDDEAPLGRPLVVVDADASVRCELEQSDRQRMNVVTLAPRHLQPATRAVSLIDVKNAFYVFFIFRTFLVFLKNVGKVQSGKQINKKHFQNNSNETDL